MLFQSTHSRGVRRYVMRDTSIETMFQSTHSRGVRPCAEKFFRNTKGFNPRTHEECDKPFNAGKCGVLRFNPRTHEECDPRSTTRRTSDRSFQSTHSRGVRQILSKKVHDLYNVSIHALTRSATMINSPTGGALLVSIHALTRSATILQESDRTYLYCFNPRTHEECDLQHTVRQELFPCFNPRTHEECDFLIKYFHHLVLVSIHALTRSATLGQGQTRRLGQGFNPRTHEECD